MLDVALESWLGKRMAVQQEGTIHPTQKPVKLYSWVLSLFARKGMRILDTHAGSGSCSVACHRLRFEWYAVEIDKDYFTKADRRIKAEQAQLSLFDF